MIDFLRKLAGLDSGTPLAPADARVALSALLVEAARTDGVYDPSERLRIDRVLATRYGLTAAQAAALRAQGELAQAEAVDLVRFTRAIKDAVPHAERIAVIEALWEVIYADGTREMYESALMRKLCGLLHVEDRDAGLARQRVAGRMGIE